MEAGRPILGRRVKVEIAKAMARGGAGERGQTTFRNSAPTSSKKTQWRLLVTGLPAGATWQEMRDHCRDHSISVLFAGARTADGASIGVLEFENEEAMKSASTTLSSVKFRGNAVHVEAETGERNFETATAIARIQEMQPAPPRARSRSRERREPEPSAQERPAHVTSSRDEDDGGNSRQRRRDD